MHSSSNYFDALKSKSSGQSNGGKKGESTSEGSFGANGSNWVTVKTEFGSSKSANSEDAGRFFRDSYKVTRDGQTKRIVTYFCNCEELDKLIRKKTLTKKERIVLRDMARRYRVCHTFAEGGRCYLTNCTHKHSWFSTDKDAFRQAACELTFTRKLCRFCKSRPNVAKQFGVNQKRKKVQKSPSSGKSDTASSTGSSSSTAGGYSKPRPSASLYDPKAHALRAAVAEQTHKLHKAEEFPVLGSHLKANRALPIPAQAEPKQVKFVNVEAKPKRTPRIVRKDTPLPPLMSKEEFEPSKESDVPLKFSELSGTDSRLAVAPAASARSEIENVYAYSEAPSEDDPNDYTSEISSQESMAISAKQEPQEASVMEEASKSTLAEEPVKVAEPVSALPRCEKSTVEMMERMESMMELMMDQIKQLQAENMALRAQTGSH